MRVALYARVSTERQERQGTIASQLDALGRFATAHDHEIVDTYVCVDDGYSGTRLDRPGLDRLRDGAEAGAFDGVLILCPDRLARKYAYQVVILEELERFGVAVTFLEQPPGDDPHARLLTQIQGAIAEYERMKIAERYRRGKLFRARQGEVICWKVPYGYRRVPRHDGVPAHVVIAEAEAQVVRQIFTWHVHEHLSVRQIALRLTESTHPTATGRRRWGPSTVTRMLHNEAYIGTMYFNRHESVEGDPTTASRRRRTKSRTRRRPASEWIPLAVPPIVDPDLFQRSQAIHVDNSRFSPRHLKSGHYLLRGLVRCRVCDLSMSCHRMRGRDGTFHHYYYCAGHDILRARTATGRCSQRNLRADELDALVWAEVRRHLEHPSLILDAYPTLQNEIASRPPDQRMDDVRNIQKKLAELEREAQRLLDAYQAGLIPLDQLKRRQGLLDQRRTHVTSSLEALQHEEANAQQQARLRTTLERFTRSVCQALGLLSFEQRQHLLRTVVAHVMIEAGHIDIHFAIPLPDPPEGERREAHGKVSTLSRLRSHDHHHGRQLPREGAAT
jgi:site-specific DNA recombinase